MAILLVIATALAIFGVGSLLAQWAWNIFISPVFALTEINFIQAVAFFLLIIAVRPGGRGGKD